MKTYNVEVIRTSFIEYEIEAEDEDTANELACQQAEDDHGPDAEYEAYDTKEIK